jgi:hypothetical protein
MAKSVELPEAAELVVVGNVVRSPNKFGVVKLPIDNEDMTAYLCFLLLYLYRQF